MASLPKTLVRSDFTFDLSHTLCGTVAYVFYNKGSYIMKNNNYRPTKEAMEDHDLMFKELAHIIINEDKVGLVSKAEKNFLESEDYIKLKKMLDV